MSDTVYRSRSESDHCMDAIRDDIYADDVCRVHSVGKRIGTQEEQTLSRDQEHDGDIGDTLHIFHIGLCLCFR
jgi:hypothetical protein